MSTPFARSVNAPNVEPELERAFARESVLNYPKYSARGVSLDDYAVPSARAVVEACGEAWEADGRVTLETAATALQRAGKLDSIGGTKGLAEFLVTTAVPDVARLRDLKRLRSMRQRALEAAAAAEAGDLDRAVALLGEAHTAALESSAMGEVRSFREMGNSYLSNLVEAQKSGQEFTIHPGLEHLHEAIGGLTIGSMLMIIANTNVGKALRATEPVLTPHGWVEIGKLSVGDEVIAADGTATRVTGVFPQGQREIHRVRFDDGAHVDADMEHRWSVASDCDRSQKRPFRVMTTREIVDSGLVSPAGRVKWSVPTVQPVEHPASDLPVDPYLLGVLLGDGCLRDGTVGLSKRDDPEVVKACSLALPDGVSMVREKGDAGLRGQHRLCAKRGQPNHLARALRAMGLMGAGSYDKFIPGQYLTASIEQRSALLRGLLDTDGTVDATGRYLGFCTTSEKLLAGLLSLVRSLGGVGRVCERVTNYTHKGEKRDGALSFHVSIAMPPTFVPFACKRKADRFKPRTRKMPNRKIVAVEPAGTDDAVCISVDHPSKLYVTRDYIVTHNSSVVLEMMLKCSERKVSTGLVSVEDDDEITTRRALSAHSGVPSRVLQEGRFDESTWARLARGIEALDASGGRMFFSDCAGGTELDVCAAMSRMAHRGAKIVIVDYIGEVEASRESRDGRRNDIRWVAKRLKVHAKRIGVALVVVSQITRPSDKNPNREPTKHDAKESGDLENMTTTMLGLWREQEDDWAPVHVKVLKHKSGGNGMRWQMERDRGSPDRPGSGRLREIGEGPR